MRLIIFGVLIAALTACEKPEKSDVTETPRSELAHDACNMLAEHLNTTSSLETNVHGTEIEYVCVLKYKDAGKGKMQFSGERLVGAWNLLRWEKNAKVRSQFFKCSKDAGCYDLFEAGPQFSCMRKCATKTGYDL